MFDHHLDCVSTHTRTVNSQAHGHIIFHERHYTDPHAGSTNHACSIHSESKNALDLGFHSIYYCHLKQRMEHSPNNPVIYIDLISPPSIRKADPVIQRAPGETRNVINSAISSGSPKRPIPASAGKVFMASSTVVL